MVPTIGHARYLHPTDEPEYLRLARPDRSSVPSGPRCARQSPCGCKGTGGPAPHKTPWTEGPCLAARACNRACLRSWNCLIVSVVTVNFLAATLATRPPNGLNAASRVQIPPPLERLPHGVSSDPGILLPE